MLRTYPRAKLAFTPGTQYPAGLRATTHDMLLDYLVGRLKFATRNRTSALYRYSKADRAISTWQVLDDEDAERKEKQEKTGQAQAIAMNLPLAHTHIDDMVAFFAAIFSPNQGDFFEVPQDADILEAGKRLVEKLNQDAKGSKYFKHLCHMLRSALKYNISGFYVDFDSVSDSNATGADAFAVGMNKVRGLDMYNCVWDPTVIDPSKIHCEAEYFAMFDLVNEFELHEHDGIDYFGLRDLMDYSYESNGLTASWYRYPPIQAGLTFEDDRTVRGNSVDWKSYGAQLLSDAAIPVQGYERVTMLCRVNPNQFGLRDGAGQLYPKGTGPVLFKFTLFSDKRVIGAEPVYDDVKSEQELPVYMGHLNQDDMAAAQRSIAELLLPFQSYASFLLNSDIQAKRGNIYGLVGYDPTMFDMSTVPAGSTAARIASKIPGRDVRSGIQKLLTDVDNNNAPQQLQMFLQLVKEFFPSQALPSQIAQIDRAVQSQVAAVLQGVSRRLHMLVRLLDDDIMNPMRMQLFRNLVRDQAMSLSGITDSQARTLLGNGLAQLNREVAAQAMQQLLFAVIQNKEAMAELDVVKLLTYWAQMLNIPFDVNSFRRQTQQGAAPTGVPGAPPTGGSPNGQAG